MSDGLHEGQAVIAEPSGRDWAGIGVGLASAFALVAIVSATVWALVVLIEAAA